MKEGEGEWRVKQYKYVLFYLSKQVMYVCVCDIIAPLQ